MSSLRKKAGNALMWDMIGGYSGQIVGFIISIFLARVLQPDEFGLVGMSLVFINVLAVFSDMGFASALVQNKNNTSLTYSSVFYLNVIAGSLLSIAIIFSAPIIGSFYQNETIVGLVQLLSVTLFINSFNIVQGTILKRNLDFKTIAARDLSAQLIGGLAAIVFAFYGFGVYALVIQQILAAIIKTILLWGSTDWHPKLEFSMPEVKKLTGYSAYVFASHSMNQLFTQIDILVIGKLFSPATLGFFSRANSVTNLITSSSTRSLNKVFFPVMSLIQDDDERFKRTYLKVLSLAVGISSFLAGILFLCGAELIVGLFGEKWEPSIFIFQILVLKGFFTPVSIIIVNAFLAKGKSRENFRYGNIRKVVQLLPIVFALYYGFEAYLYALVIFGIIGWLMNNYFVTRSLGITYWEQIKVVIPELMAATITTAVIYALLPNERSILWALVRIGIFSAVYLGYTFISKTTLWSEIHFYAKEMKVRLSNR